MSSLIIRRLLIFLFVGTTLFTLEIATEETLLLNLPSHEDVIESILDKQKQEEEIQEELDKSISRDQNQDYLDLFNHSVRHTFIIEFTQEEWDGLIDDMISYNDMFGSYRSNNYRNVTVTYVSDDDVFTIEDVGFRSKGNIYSRYLPVDQYGSVREIHFMLKFNEIFDLEENTLEYDALKTREVFDIEQLLFKWNNQGDRSYSNEVFAHEMFDQIGVVTPEASFAEVKIVIDGVVELVSFYNIFEHLDEEFIRKSLQDTPTQEVGDLYKGTWFGSLEPIFDTSLIGVRDWETNYRPVYGLETNVNKLEYSNLILFTYGLNKPDLTERQEYLETNFNIDSYIRSMAMNVLLGNPDDYRSNSNNFYLYFDENDYLTYIPFDYDNSMGSGWNGLPAFIDYSLGNDIYEWGVFPWNNFGAPLTNNLFEYDEYRILYEDYLMQFIEEGIYSVESYSELFNVVNRLYGGQFNMVNDKVGYINVKTQVVTNQVEYYRNLR